MIPLRPESRQILTAERNYRRLLALYPKRFRQEYGESMALLFRDQHNAACQEANAAGRAGRLKFWLHLLADLGWTAGSEHFSEFKNFMSEKFAKHFWSKPGSSVTKVFVAIFALLAGVLTIELVFRLPKVYSSMARVAVLP